MKLYTICTISLIVLFSGCDGNVNGKSENGAGHGTGALVYDAYVHYVGDEVVVGSITISSIGISGRDVYYTKSSGSRGHFVLNDTDFASCVALMNAIDSTDVSSIVAGIPVGFSNQVSFNYNGLSLLFNEGDLDSGNNYVLSGDVDALRDLLENLSVANQLLTGV